MTLTFSASLVAIGFLLVPGCSSPLQTFFTTSCAADTDIPAKDRQGAGEAAMEFVGNALGPNASTAYSALSAGAKENVSSEQFAATLWPIRQMGPFKNLRVAHTYLARVKGGTQTQRVVCGNVSRPQDWVAVSADPGPSQAHVIVEGETVNNTWAFSVWLIPELGAWRIHYFHVASSRAAGKSAGDLQETARAQREKHHDFNAYILYMAALQQADRGPNFQLGILPEIQKDIAALRVPRHLQGQPPFEWQFGGSIFKVLNVGPIAVGGKIYLKIDHEIESWRDDKEADRKNRDLIAEFAKTYPEYRDAFAGLVVSAHERGGRRGFGTMDESRQPSK